VESVVHQSIDAVLVECNCMRLHTKEANSMKLEMSLQHVLICKICLIEAMASVDADHEVLAFILLVVWKWSRCSCWY